MTDRPISFSAPMVRALLDGRKTQTRRVLKPQPEVNSAGLLRWERKGWWVQGKASDVAVAQRIQPGDRLWVREHWRTTQAFEDLRPSQMTPENTRVKYLADDFVDNKGKRFAHFHDGRRRHGMHMPRWASRLTLVVTGVSVARLQDISRGDAMQEGCPFPNMADGQNPRDWFKGLWDQINGEGAWDANPWVGAYTFTVIAKNIDEVSP